MTATIRNLDIDAGMDFLVDTVYSDYITGLPIDITGYSALLEVKPEYPDPRVLISLSSDAGQILLGGKDGTILVKFSAADTTPSLQPFFWVKASYDLVLTSPTGSKTKVLGGFVNLIGTVSI